LGQILETALQTPVVIAVSVEKVQASAISLVAEKREHPLEIMVNVEGTMQYSLCCAEVVIWE
jgi:hypothetical protein